MIPEFWLNKWGDGQGMRRLIADTDYSEVVRLCRMALRASDSGSFLCWQFPVWLCESFLAAQPGICFFSSSNNCAIYLQNCLKNPCLLILNRANSLLCNWSLPHIIQYLIPGRVQAMDSQWEGNLIPMIWTGKVWRQSRILCVSEDGMLKVHGTQW